MGNDPPKSNSIFICDCKMQGFRPCTPLKDFLKKVLKNPKNLKNIIYPMLLNLFGVQNLFWGTACSARFLVGVRGQSPLKNS
jgi:hypothetical protein